MRSTLDEPIEQLESRGIAPVHVLQDAKYVPALLQAFDAVQDGCENANPSELGIRLDLGKSLTPWQMQQGGKDGYIIRAAPVIHKASKFLSPLLTAVRGA